MCTARSDDTKGLKPVMIDWITEGSPASASVVLRRNPKTRQGFQSELTGRLLYPTDVDWNDPK